MASSVTITIDDRERAGGLVEALRARAGGWKIEVRRLEAGDILIGERLLIERKEAADFVASLLDGRLERQLDGMIRSRLQAMFIIEGEFSRPVLAGLAPETVRQAILALQLDWRLPVLRSRGLEDTAQWILALADREARGLKPLSLAFRPQDQPRGAHPAAHRSPRPPAGAGAARSAPCAALERVPGVGKAKAEALIRHFGSIEGLMRAGMAELTAVPGIGPETAQAIRQAFSKV